MKNEKSPADSHPVSRLEEIITRLRGPGGCPWDAEQTPDSVRRYLVEEACEAAEAISDGNPAEVREELGDLLFQVIFTVRLYEEQGDFELAGVVEKVVEKMIRRHPHVFGEVEVADSRQVLVNWQRIKSEENGGEPGSALGRIPRGMPSLMRADRLSRRAANVGFDWSGPEAVWDKVVEETDELNLAMEQGDRDASAEELGDLFFALANLARHLDLEPEALLQAANTKFESRFKSMEGRIRDRGLRVEETDVTTLNRVWDEVKAGS